MRVREQHGKQQTGGSDLPTSRQPRESVAYPTASMRKCDQPHGSHEKV